MTFLSLLASMLLICSPYFSEQLDPYQPNSPLADIEFKSNEQQQDDGDIPLIVWWMDLYPHYIEDTEKRMIPIDCDGVKCLSTNVKSHIDDPRTRAILFYGTTINIGELPLPRNTNHEWCLYHEESPMNNFLLSQESFIRLFNHTSTFRRESDYPVTTQNIYSLKFLTDRKPIPLKQKNAMKHVRNLASVMYAQSHHNVASYRNAYVKELMKYIKIDSYGTQLHNKDLPSHLVDPEQNFEKKEFLDYISVYKFHLAFENAVCKDYMTEKLMRPLHVGSVPIYYGSPDAKDWMPNNNTVIMVNDFKSPKELAEFISYLDNNDEEYEKYLTFKKPGGVTNKMLLDHMENRPWGTHDVNFHHYNEEYKPDSLNGLECYICHQVTKRVEREKAHAKDPSIPLLPPKMANSSHMGCPEPFLPVQLEGFNIDKDEKSVSEDGEINWIPYYKSQERVAAAVNKMLYANETDSSKYMDYFL